MKSVLGVVFCAMACTVLAAEPLPIDFTSEGVEVQVSAKQGVKVFVDKVPFSNNSTFSVMSDDWHHAWYTNDRDKHLDWSRSVSRSPDGSQQLVLPIADDDHVVSGSRTITLGPGRRLSIRVDVEKTSSVQLRVEHRMASIDSAWFAGRSWKALSNDGITTSGVMPAVALFAALEPSTIVKAFKNLTVETLAGNLGVKASGNVPISLVDYRKNQWSNGLNYYWFGLLSSHIPGAGLHYETTFSFPSPVEGNSRSWIADATAVTSSPEVLQPRQSIDDIVPTPKQLKWGTGSLEITGRPAVALPKPVAFLRGSDAALVHSMITSIFGSGSAGSTTTSATSNISIAVADFSFLKGNDGAALDPALRNEPYTLEVGDEIKITASTTSGVLNALKSLGQIVTTSGSQTALVRRCSVTDYPSLPFRGIHFFTGKGGRDVQIRMLRNVLGPMKINELVYQCDYMEWDSVPELRNPEFGMKKADAAAVAACAQSEGIEVIPLVNTFGHSEWFLDYPKMRHLSDNPDYPFAYDPSNPEVYKLCDAIYREAVTMFHPRIMHIGHDEIDFEGFPSRPANRATGTTKLIENDIRHYYDLLSGLGVKTMMWGDMLLAPGESPDATLAKTKAQAEERRAALPKDVIIADWHYAPAEPSAFKSLKILNDAGLKSVACTWDTSDNIINFTKAAVKQRQENPGCLGLLQTTWAGYNFNEKAFRANVNQYAAYVLAAEAAWTGASGFDRSTFDFQKVFARLWNANTLPASSAAGWTVRLPELAPEELNRISQYFRWNASGLGELTRQKGEIGRLHFGTGNGRGLPMLVFSGKFNGEAVSGVSDAVIPVKRKADTLAFALSASVAAPRGAKIGTMEITFSDDKVEKVPLIMGQNVSAVSDDVSSLYSPVWWSHPGKGTEPPFAVHGLLWHNKNHRSQIENVRFISANSGSAIVLFGTAGILSEK